MTHLITGSELVIAGGIPRKVGNRRFTCFGNQNEYHDQVQLSLTESDKEGNSEDADDKNKNGHSMDTSVPKMLKNAACQAIQIKKVRCTEAYICDRKSLEKLSESCSSNKDNEGKDRDPIPQADCKTMDDENPRYPPAPSEGVGRQNLNLKPSLNLKRCKT